MNNVNISLFSPLFKLTWEQSFAESRRLGQLDNLFANVLRHFALALEIWKYHLILFKESISYVEMVLGIVNQYVKAFRNISQ